MTHGMRFVCARELDEVLAGTTIEGNVLKSNVPNKAGHFLVHVLTDDRSEANDFARVLEQASRARPVFRLDAEGDRLRLTRLSAGEGVERVLARKDPHGRWLEWL